MTRTMRIEARVLGEMSPADIPLAKGVDIDAIKGDDPEPLEVVVEIPAGKSTRQWNYREESLQDIVNFVNENTLPGYLGHQKQENIDTEFATPVTHWVGAKFEQGKALFRGIVDKAAPDLKRWIKSGRVRQVSIFGMPKLLKAMGETEVVGYKPFSIDWTPLHRAGMPTKIVAVGELDSTFDVGGELDGSAEELSKAIVSALRAKNSENDYLIEKLYYGEKKVIYREYTGEGDGLYQVSFMVEEGDKITFGDKVEVKEVITYELVGELAGGGEPMDLKEMLAYIRNLLTEGKLKLEDLHGEIGVTKDQLIDAYGKDYKMGAELGVKLIKALGFNKDMVLEDSLKVAGEMAVVWDKLGFNENKPENPGEAVEEMVKATQDRVRQEREKLFGEMLDSKVTTKEAKSLVKKLIGDKIDELETEEQICGEIDAVLGDEDIKAIIGKAYVDKPAPKGEAGKETRNATRTRKASLL